MPGGALSMRCRCSITSPISAMRGRWRSIRHRRPIRSSRRKSNCRLASLTGMCGCRSASSTRTTSSPISSRRSRRLSQSEVDVRTSPSPQPSPRKRGEGAHRRTTSRASADAELSLSWPVDLGLTVASHGWVHLEPWRWEPETGTLSHAERIDGRAGMIAVRQRDLTKLDVSWCGFPRRMLEDAVLAAAGQGDPARRDHDYVRGLEGIGPYAAAHCRMLLHDFGRIPVDSVVVAHLRERHATTPAAFIAARAACGLYLGLGYRLMRLKEKFQVAQVELPPASQRPESAY